MCARNSFTCTRWRSETGHFAIDVWWWFTDEWV